jgi:hypothetical protein
MIYKICLTIALLPALLAGCGTTISGDSYCDLSSNIMFGEQSVIDSLAVSDPQLLRQIVIHNETRQAVCVSS